MKEEGAILSTCPRCHTEVTGAEKKFASRLPPSVVVETASGKLDLAALMRRVLAEQPPGENVDAALERVVAREHSESAATIVDAIQRHLKLLEERLGYSRQQAAEMMSKSVEFLSFDSEGKPSVEGMIFETTVLEKLSPEARSDVMEQMKKAFLEGKPLLRQIVGPPEVKIQGLEELPEETRLEVLEQIKKAIEEGQPIPRRIVSRSVTKVQGSSGLTLFLFLLVLGALILGYLLSRH